MCANFFMINLDVIITFMLQLFSSNKENLAKHVTCRSSRPEVFRKTGVLRNFTKFTKKYLCQGRFFNEVAVIKKRLWHRCFPVNFMRFLTTPFFAEHLRWLFLYTIKPFRYREIQDTKKLKRETSFLIEAAVNRCFSKQVFLIVL